MKKNNTNFTSYRMMFVYDILVVLAFVVLAVIFCKWWIALFALLFLVVPSGKVIKQYYRVCDHCGKRSPGAQTYNQAIDDAVSAGWLHKPCTRNDNSDQFEDYCPDCRKELGLYE